MTTNYELFLSAIRTGDDERTEDAVQALWRNGDGSLASLLDLAVIDDDDLRWWAVRALAVAAEEHQQHRAAAMPALTRALSDTDDSIRCLAALSLGQLKAASAIPALLVLLTDPSGWVRGAAADGLALMGEAAVPALGSALHDDQEGVRVRAAYALYRIRSMSSARWLFPALNDPNPIVHTYVYETLDEMGLLNTVLVQ
ncbi:MAG: HEAT repeat domain-containing protein [Anaerolineae bacterium]|nr:HEAT repeat domain-containing protein [Anaerolineae bacterium]MCB9131853.1 HEAT repeat domain-containing protein [Anaerolineales bacterium]MCB0232886.1 HEAT repeat domain-containing protein [Anaerolineae bacterium]MCB0239248.1 HEAT repeat domain-containing protein [Anaerolineae bacterium]MCB0242798.1 HEAT repeat domain-containing protein [Anaerolineae bacterium]